ncbi:hypothetical protein CMV_015145 [Castanea mollissima]|uniref:Berberine/berberine-like domain-containing protein n=1 Tax=Castanea mollissima TaxID=60419 RepID=A0A8J4VKB8_9ROSI|nr:hypothetical protein CMV_015145 [Castanea mollissima]
MMKPESEKNNSIIIPFLIVKFFLALLLVPYCLSASTAVAAATDHMITFCLTHHNIKNFTTFPGDLESDDQPTAYFKLLNFSIQNLRFVESTIPKPIAIILPETVDQLLHALICCREGSLEIRVRSVSRPGTKSHVAELVNKWQYVAPYLEDNFYLSCFVGANLPEAISPGISASFNGFYLGPRSKAISILKQVFPELGIVEEDCKEMTWIESVVFFSGLSNGSSVSDLKNRYLQDKGFFKAKSDYVRTPISLMGIRAALDTLEKEPKGHIILDPYGGIMQNISSDYIPFPHRRGNLFSIQYLVTWKEEDNNKSSQYIDWIRGFYNSMAPFVSSGPRAAFVNYMDFDLGVMKLVSTSVQPEDAVEIARLWGEKYFLKNYDRLVRVKTLIDPNNVFRNQQGIPPNSRPVSKQRNKE